MRELFTIYLVFCPLWAVAAARAEWTKSVPELLLLAGLILWLTCHYVGLGLYITAREFDAAGRERAAMQESMRQRVETIVRREKQCNP